MTSNMPALLYMTITMIEPRYAIASFQSCGNFLLYQSLHLLLMVTTKLYPTISKSEFPTVKQIKV